MEIVDGFVVVSGETAIRLITDLTARDPAGLSEVTFETQISVQDGIVFCREKPGGFARYSRDGLPWIAVRQVEPGPLIGVVWDGTMFGDTDFAEVSGDST